MSATKALTVAELKKRIADLEATPREMVGTDEGTHQKAALHYVYEEITGERYATRSFAGANAVRLDGGEEEAAERTDGHIRVLSANQSSIRAARAELQRLREQLRRAQS
jgi:hypothetical protein